ncbi:unnamed protein product [Linum trigynum]|uniref:Uncharacterized protein n=1 Tax=Linum trigynum TaxID=586398 RepID=A0AAV2G2A8_9ROSI
MVALAARHNEENGHILEEVCLTYPSGGHVRNHRPPPPGRVVAVAPPWLKKRRGGIVRTCFASLIVSQCSSQIINTVLAILKRKQENSTELAEESVLWTVGWRRLLSTQNP